MKFLITALLVAMLIILLLAPMPEPPASVVTSENGQVEIDSVASIAMSSGACGMRPPQLE